MQQTLASAAICPKKVQRRGEKSQNRACVHSETTLILYWSSHLKKKLK